MTLSAFSRSVSVRPSSILVLLGLAGWFALVSHHHEIGHDEAQAWNIARGAVAPLDTLARSLYEGHTPPWFLALWIVGRGGDPVAMQALSAGLALGFAALLLRDRPFGTVGTLLVLAGYYPFYEYPIISRPYALALLLCALLATCYRSGTPRSPLLPAALCAAIALTSAYGILLSLAFMAMVAWRALDDPRRDGSLGSVMPAASLWLVAAAASAWYVLTPLAGFGLELAGGGRVGDSAVGAVLSTPIWPHADRLPVVGLLLDTGAGEALRLLTALAVAAVVLARLIPDRALALGWLIALMAIGAGGWFSGLMSERHLGHVWLAAVTLCWIRARDARPSPWRIASAGHPILVATLAWHAVVGAAASGYDLLRPIAPGERLAHDIGSAMGATPYALLADYMYDAGAAAARLERPVFEVRCGCFTTYYDWRWSRVERPEERLVEAACRLRADGTAVVLLAKERVAAGIPGTTLLSPPIRTPRDDDASIGAWRLDESVTDACPAKLASPAG